MKDIDSIDSNREPIIMEIITAIGRWYAYCIDIYDWFS